MSDNTWGGKDTLTALLVVLIWGVNFVPMKIGLQALTPLELGLARYFFALFPLIFFVKFPKVRFRWVIATAFFQGVLQFNLLFIALEVGMTAALASVLLQTQIYFTALWGFLIYRHRPTGLLWLSMLIAGIGLAFFTISAVQESSGDSVNIYGLLFTLGSASMWAVANLISRQAQYENPNYSALGLVVWGGLFACFFYFILMVIFQNDASRWLSAATWQSIGLETWGSGLYLGWGSTLAGYALWTQLLKRHHANKVAPFSLGVPVVGLAAGLIFLQESVDIWQWIGSVFVGLSLSLVVFGPRWLRRRMQKKQPT